MKPLEGDGIMCKSIKLVLTLFFAAVYFQLVSGHSWGVA